MFSIRISSFDIFLIHYTHANPKTNPISVPPTQRVKNKDPTSKADALLPLTIPYDI